MNDVAVVDVAVGVVEDSSGRILIAKRAVGVHQGDRWEFPGGKFEVDETALAALTRELAEELGVNVLRATPMCVIEHDYGDKRVRLHVQRVTDFTGEPRGIEGQPLLWVLPFELWRYRFPTANRPILRQLALPQRLAITGAFADPDSLLQGLRRAHARGADGFYLRIAAESFEPWQRQVMSEFCQHHQCLFFLPSYLSVAPGQGRHWRTGEWHQSIAGYPQSAAVHSQAELLAAQTAGADLILLSPVAPTQTHPQARALGWPGFADLAKVAQVPVLALGGMGPDDVHKSLAAGGSGIAAISNFWN